MANLTNSPEKVKFLPDWLWEFVKRSTNRFIGFILLSISVIYGLSLVSYSPLDPSFNVVNANHPQNLMSTFGSYSADLAYQMVGFGCYIPFFMGLGWAWRFLTSTPIRRVGLRLASGIVTIALSAVLFGLIEALFPAIAFHRPLELVNLGGMIGYGMTWLVWNGFALMQGLVPQFQRFIKAASHSPPSSVD